MYAHVQLKDKDGRIPLHYFLHSADFSWKEHDPFVVWFGVILHCPTSRSYGNGRVWGQTLGSTVIVVLLLNGLVT